jgi:hypothetical protein
LKTAVTESDKGGKSSVWMIAFGTALVHNGPKLSLPFSVLWPADKCPGDPKSAGKSMSKPANNFAGAALQGLASIALPSADFMSTLEATPGIAS